jgi:3-deoxy-D-arabino-heptulosonate 7-phosphate (DAHP) synthase class II
MATRAPARVAATSRLGTWVSLSINAERFFFPFNVVRVADIVAELSASIRIHNRLGSRLGGVHLEMTGEVNEDGYSVTECLGGSMELQDEELSKNYQVTLAVFISPGTCC